MVLFGDSLIESKLTGSFHLMQCYKIIIYGCEYMGKRDERIKGINEAANWLGERIGEVDFSEIQKAYDIAEKSNESHTRLNKWNSEEMFNYKEW